MGKVTQIIEGFYNNLTNKEDDLYTLRIKICKKCPLYIVDEIFGQVCNPALYINTKGVASKVASPGYIKGCGCLLSSKTRVPDAACIVKKW